MIDPVYSHELLYEKGSELSAEGVLELAKKATGDQLEAERLWSKRYLEIDAEKRRLEAKVSL
jgi:hypothetical protein